MIPYGLVETKRIPYPVVRKEKFTLRILCGGDFTKLKDIIIQAKYKDSDLKIKLPIKKSNLIKINIKDYEELYKKKFNLNSCEIVPDIIKEESQRITKEQADKLNTFWKKYCFFKDWEENSHKSVMKKVNEVEKNVSLNVQQVEKKVVTLLDCEIYNSIFSKKSYGVNCLFHDFSNDPTGLTLIQGKNGGCKSTFFGFASPYPVFIGFDYRSLKDFFPEGGRIIKRFDINGVIHEHQIHIPEDHNKKILCYWNIETETKIKQSLLKDFMIECEKFFGPITSFISTSFFAQEPWRMKKYVSSLVSSSETELRNAYMEIIGISRAAWKEYAHEKVKKIKQEIHDFEIEKNTMSKVVADKDTVKNEQAHLLGIVTTISNDEIALKLETNEKQKEFDKIDKEYKEQQKIESDIINEQGKLYGLDIKKTETKEKISRLEKINIDELKKQLKDNTEKVQKLDFLRDQWQDINKHKTDIEKKIKISEQEINIFNQEINDIVINLNSMVKDIESRKNQNELLKTPCHYCGKIPDPKSEEKIKNNTELNKNYQLKIDQGNVELEKYKNQKKKNEKIIAELKEKLPTEQLKNIEDQASKLKLTLLDESKIQAIQNSITEYSQIKIYQENLETIKSDIEKTNEIIKALKSKKNPFTEPQYNKISQELSELQNQLQEKQKEISSKEGMLKKVNEELEKINKFEKEITEILKKLDILVVDFDEWEMFEKDMMPHKFPALELQLIAEDIDFEVNKKLNGKYIIKTNTQDINKKGDIIDRFSITVYDPVSGVEDPLLNYSPGQRSAFFIEPISQALREKRQQRENIQFMWSVADETDNFIKYDIVREYYEIMNQGLPEGHTRFIMSQKSEIYQFIKNTIDIEKVGKNI